MCICIMFACHVVLCSITTMHIICFYVASFVVYTLMWCAMLLYAHKVF